MSSQSKERTIKIGYLNTLLTEETILKLFYNISDCCGTVSIISVTPALSL